LTVAKELICVQKLAKKRKRHVVHHSVPNFSFLVFSNWNWPKLPPSAHRLAAHLAGILAMASGAMSPGRRAPFGEQHPARAECSYGTDTVTVMRVLYHTPRNPINIEE
jgi:hypothetical protein